MCFGSKSKHHHRYDTATNGVYNPYGPPNRGPATRGGPKSKASKILGVDEPARAPPHAGGVLNQPRPSQHPHSQPTKDYHQVRKNHYGRNADELMFADGRYTEPLTPAIKPLHSAPAKAHKAKADPRPQAAPIPFRNKSNIKGFNTPEFGSPIWNPASRIPSQASRPSTAHFVKRPSTFNSYKSRHQSRAPSPVHPNDAHRTFSGPVSPQTPYPHHRHHSRKHQRGFSAPGRPSLPPSLQSGISLRHTASASAPPQLAHIGSQHPNGVPAAATRDQKSGFKLHPAPAPGKAKYAKKPLPAPPVPPKPNDYKPVPMPMPMRIPVPGQMQKQKVNVGGRVASQPPQLPPVKAFAPLGDIGRMSMGVRASGSARKSVKSVGSSRRTSARSVRSVKMRGVVGKGRAVVVQAPKVRVRSVKVGMGGGKRRRRR